MEVIGEFLAVVHMIPTAVVSTLKPVILTLFAKDTGPFSPPYENTWTIRCYTPI